MSLLIRISLQLGMLGFLAVPPSPGQDVPVKALQDALKERGFYFGATTGAFDESTREAIKRFQMRQGLTATGDVDKATWQALQRRSAPATPVPVSPSPPQISVRERAQNLRQSDREFLEKVEAIGLPDSFPVEQATERTASPPLAPVAKPPPVAEQRVDDDPGTPPPRISEGEAREFVESYLQAAEAPSPEREVSFYGDQVDYFDSGKVGRTFIQKDQNSYYRRWPKRDFKLLSAPEVNPVSSNAASVRFRVRYALSGNRKRAVGQVENYLRVRKSDDGLKIVAIRERKLR